MPAHVPRYEHLLMSVRATQTIAKVHVAFTMRASQSHQRSHMIASAIAGNLKASRSSAPTESTASVARRRPRLHSDEGDSGGTETHILWRGCQ